MNRVFITALISLLKDSLFSPESQYSNLERYAIMVSIIMLLVISLLGPLLMATERELAKTKSELSGCNASYILLNDRFLIEHEVSEGLRIELNLNKPVLPAKNIFDKPPKPAKTWGNSFID